MSLTKHYKTDQNKEVAGVPIYMPKNDDGTVPTFVISRSSLTANPRFAKARERIMRPHAARQRTKTLPEAEQLQLYLQIFIEGSLITWQNIPLSDVTGDDADTGYAEFSNDNAAKLFARLPDLAEDLQMQANDVSLFRNGDAEANAKN